MKKQITTTLDAYWHPRLEIINQTRNMVAICQDEKISYINPAGAKLLGYNSPKDVLGKLVSNFFHQDYKDVVELGLEVLSEDDTLFYCKLIHSDLRELDVETKVIFLEGANPKTYMLEVVDISEHLKTAMALRSREQRLEGILNTVADGIVTVNDKGIIQTFNPAAENIFRMTQKEAIGQNVRMLMPRNYQETLLSGTGVDWAKTLSEDKELTGIRKSGQTFPMELDIRELSQGDILSFTGVVRDISLRKKTEEEMTRLAHYDQLTGLASRFLLTDRFKEAVKTAKRSKKIVALLFLDLNKFKTINDTLGHNIGDEVLKRAAERLKLCIRETDTVARVGGDEFVILLSTSKNPQDYIGVAEKIVEELDIPFEIEGNICQIGVSVGISLHPLHGTDMETLIEYADTAMYQSKRKGGGTYTIYKPVGTEA